MMPCTMCTCGDELIVEEEGGVGVGGRGVEVPLVIDDVEGVETRTIGRLGVEEGVALGGLEEVRECALSVKIKIKILVNGKIYIWR